MSKLKKLLFVAGAFAFGAFAIVTGWGELRDSKKLAAEGKSVSAEVTDKDMRSGRRGRKSYYLDIQFKTEAGATVDRRLRVSSAQYDAASPGGHVPAHYLPSNPSVCQIGEKVETKWDGLLIGFGAWVVGAVLGFWKSKEEGTEDVAETENLAASESSDEEQQKAA